MIQLRSIFKWVQSNYSHYMFPEHSCSLPVFPTWSQMSLSVLLDRFDRTITRTAPLGLSVLGVSSVYYIAFSYGLGVIALVFGKDGATQVSCPAAARLIRWSSLVLTFLCILFTPPPE